MRFSSGSLSGEGQAPQLELRRSDGGEQPDFLPYARFVIIWSISAKIL
jgi:hypothetical protein